MGGNAITATSVRLTDKNYYRLAPKVLQGLKNVLPGRRMDLIPALAEKPDFGDMDILVQHPGVLDEDIEHVAKAIGAGEALRHDKNSRVVSFGVPAVESMEYRSGNAFQIDLIAAPAFAYEFALNYFSFGDFGNFMGCIARAMSTQLRHDGLYYRCIDGTQKYGEILLTTNFSQALEFLGFDPRRFERGFANNLELFEAIANSKFFNRSIFLLENNNARSRVRKAKRENYLSFLKWCEQRADDVQYAYPDDRRKWLSRIAEHFSNFEPELSLLDAMLENHRVAKVRLNGEIAGRLTGLSGPELGELLSRFRGQFESDAERTSFLMAASDEDIAFRLMKIKGEMSLSREKA